MSSATANAPRMTAPHSRSALVPRRAADGVPLASRTTSSSGCPLPSGSTSRMRRRSESGNGSLRRESSGNGLDRRGGASSALRAIGASTGAGFLVTGGPLGPSGATAGAETTVGTGGATRAAGATGGRRRSPAGPVPGRTRRSALGEGAAEGGAASGPPCSTFCRARATMASTQSGSVGEDGSLEDTWGRA
jgi:hypothetical protein